jgi:hypothetical protein
MAVHTAPVTLRRLLGHAAATLVMTCCATETWYAVTLWDLHDATARYLASPGKGTVSPVGVAENTRDQVAAWHGCVLATTAAVFLVWLWLVRTAAGRAECRLPRGWTLACWWVPGVNAYLPKVALDDVWRAFHPAGTPPSRVIAGWAVAWAATLLTAAWTVVTHFQPDPERRTEQVAEAHTVLTATLWTAGILLTTVILHVNRGDAKET